jgi:prepilin-type N-terminal cleavage/methylation domain-containing protein
MLSTNQQLRGFTLVELAITIIILGMLFAMGIPAFRSLSQSQLLVANTENIAAEFRMLRQRALSQSSDQVLHFTANFLNSDYHLHQPSGYIYPLGKLAPGITLYAGTGTSASFTMHRDGTIDPAAMVILQNTRGMRDTVSVQVSGLVLTK